MTHFFDTEVAARYGVKAAVIFQNLVFWCQHSEANATNYHDGHYWTYNSAKALAELFPYMTEKQIRTALNKLLADGVVIKGKYNDNKYDQTLWYAISDKGKSILPTKKYDFTKKENRKLENGESYITDINTDNKPIVVDAADPRDDVDFNTIESYVSANIDKLSPGNMEELEGYKEDLPDELIRYAVDEASANGVRNWAYVRKILNAIVDKGFKTVGEAKAAADRKRQQKAQPEIENPALKAKFY